MARGMERPPLWAVIVMVVSALLLAVGTPFALSRGQVDSAAGQGAEVGSDAAATPTGPEILADRSVLFVGDSWTAGYGASDPEATGFVPLITADLGLDTRVISTSGAGYAHLSPTGQTIASSVEAAPGPAPNLVILMAGVNDAAEDRDAVADGAIEAIRAVQGLYPDAQVIVLGPMPPSEASVAGMTAVGEAVRFQVAGLDVRYVDTIREDWLPVAQLGELIDPAKLYHPNDAGHRLIADRLVSIIRPMLPE